MRANAIALLTVLAMSWASASWAGPNMSLVRAEKLYDDLDYDGAAVALLEASKTPRNDLKTVTRVLELQGMIASALDHKDTALTFFKELLTLSPAFELNPKTSSSKQRKLLDQARKMLADVRPLKLEAAPAQAKPGLVETVGVKVPADPLTMAKKVRFMIKVADEAYKEQVVPLNDSKAIAKVGAPGVSWYAELWGEHDAVLAMVGTMDKPIVLRAPEPEPAFGSIDLSGMKPWALASGVAGLLTGGAGIYFGIHSKEAADKIAAARAQAVTNGVVSMYTMRDAQTITDIANFHAIAANVCWVTGLLLAGGGVTLWVLDSGPATPPTGLKLSVAGTF